MITGVIIQYNNNVGKPLLKKNMQTGNKQSKHRGSIQQRTDCVKIHKSTLPKGNCCVEISISTIFAFTHRTLPIAPGTPKKVFDLEFVIVKVVDHRHDLRRVYLDGRTRSAFGPVGAPGTTFPRADPLAPALALEGRGATVRF